MIRFFVVLMLMSIGSACFGQYIMTNRKLIDKRRYDDTKGNPYFYKNPIKANLTIAGDSTSFDVLMNINLVENQLEVFQGKYYSIIERDKIKEVVMENSSSLIFLGDKLLIFPHVGPKYKLSNAPKIRIETKVLRPPGQIITKKRFVKKDQYEIFDQVEVYDISINKKSIEKVLGKDAVKLAKKHKIKLKKEKDLVALLKLLEAQ